MDLAELRELLAAGQLVVFAGAALSVAPPACAPLFRPLRSMLYDELAGSLSGDLPGALLLDPERLFDAAGRLRHGVEPAPEILFEALDVGAFPLYLLLAEAVGVSDPNYAHRVLAGWLGSACPLVITTNFDRGIEDAAGALGKQPVVAAAGETISGSLGTLGSAEHGVIWKPHGSLGDPATIRVTLQEVAAERHDSVKLGALAAVLRRFPVLVIGYSGYDHDLSSVFRACADDGRRLWWLCRSEPQPTEPAHLIARGWQDRGTILVGDLAELLTTLAPDHGPARPTAGSCAEAHAQRRAAVRSRLRGMPALLRLISLAMIYRSLGEHSAAADVFGRASALARPEGSAAGTRASLAVNRAEMLRRSGRLPEALDTLTSPSFLADLEHSSMREGLAEALIQRGQVLGAMGRTSEGAADLRMAAELSVGSPFEERAQALLSMAALGGDPSQVRARLLEARDRFGAVADRHGLMRVDHELAILAIDRGDAGEASKLLTAVVGEARELGDAEAEQLAVHELAIAAGKEENWAQASSWLDAYDAIAAYRGDVAGIQMSRALRGDIAVDQALAARDEAGLSAAVADLTSFLQEDPGPRPRALALRALVWAAAATLDAPLAEQSAASLTDLAGRTGLPGIAALADGARQLLERARPYFSGG